MPVFAKPLTDSVARPLRAGVVWGVLAGAAGVAIAFGVGGIGYAATWVGSRFGDTTPGWPEPVVTGALTVAAMASLAAATWAACFASAARPVARTVVAAALGAVVVGFGLTSGAPVAMVTAAVVAWSLGIPFERWSRLLARLLPGLGVGVVAWVVAADVTPLVDAALVAAAYPFAASSVGIGDRSWRTLAWKRSPAP